MSQCCTLAAATNGKHHDTVCEEALERYLDWYMGDRKLCPNCDSHHTGEVCGVCGYEEHDV